MRIKRLLYNGTLDVRWFGAVGNGMTDDTAAIQAALDAVPSGGTVWIPEGEYRIDALIELRPKSYTDLRLSPAQY
ncbi:hypothetical protein FE784_33420 [Paenibacillus hemerocallicola]|uniref:Rhamnogalacturonase A/B/Epimerase-like pectate lyase domain-containing protein n=2 Tax=Paenibacillus hemerocallicola TaxID=1172614 RepID=A0A5C4T192_9BACL|nr:hypothetical protein FE784_33420 [Paenibacillus hemerocallicola]